MTENIKEALEYAVELSGNEEKIMQDQHGREYYDRNKYDLVELKPKRYYPETLSLSTLTSLVDYYKDNLNNINDAKTIVVVHSPSLVSVYTEDNDRKKRTELIRVRAELPKIEFGRFIAQEEFNIMLQSKFVKANDRDLVLDYASKISIQDGADLEDNGVSQVTTVKSGVASKSKAVAPNPVTLKPYRTFHEVEQPSSNFVFRIDKCAEMALFEADGGMWVSEAKQNVANYLTKELTEYTQAKVLA